MNEQLRKERIKSTQKAIKELRRAQKEKLKLTRKGYLPCPAYETVFTSIIDLSNPLLACHTESTYPEARGYILRLEEKIAPFKRQMSLSPTAIGQRKQAIAEKNFHLLSKRGSKVVQNFVRDLCGITYSFE